MASPVAPAPPRPTLPVTQSVVAPVAVVLSNIDEEKRCKEPIPDIDGANLEDLIRNIDGETGDSIGNDITGNEDTKENCHAEQILDTAASSACLGDSDQINMDSETSSNSDFLEVSDVFDDTNSDPDYTPNLNQQTGRPTLNIPLTRLAPAVTQLLQAVQLQTNDVQNNISTYETDSEIRGPRNLEVGNALERQKTGLGTEKLKKGCQVSNIKPD
ncbi:hypothetical protein J6590_060149 [Homalodisca vitripennis]|nr:hypothetical protein J6590_060149 [Homalodisca vitripennis]